MTKRVICQTLIAILFLIIFIASAALFALLAFSDGPATNTTASPIHTVIIDAGHGGEDGGAVGNDGTCEKALNLDIAFVLQDMLRAEGINVIMTRTEDILLYDPNEDYQGRKKVLDLKSRLKISQDNPDSLFISIHMNAFPQKKYDGLQVYYPLEDASSKQLATIIQQTTKQYLQSNNMRRPKGAGSNIYLLDENPNRSILIECGFLSNDAECARLNTAEYRQQLSLVIYNSIMKYISSYNKSP